MGGEAAIPLPRRAGVPKGAMLVPLQPSAALADLILDRFSPLLLFPIDHGLSLGGL